MLSRTKKFILIILIIYLLLTTWQIVLAFKDGAGLIPLNGKAVDISVMLFFSIQPNGWNENIINLVMMLAFVPTFGAGLLIYCKNNNMFGAVQQRIGYHDFIKGGIINSFIVGFLFSLMTNLYQLALIRVFYYPFFFKIRPRKLYIGARPGYFSTNQLIDLFSYVILAAVGWGIFAVFIFSIGLFVSKNSIYLILGPCVGLGLTLLSVLMSRKGNSLDDGLMEGFFGILKREMFYGFEKHFKNLTELEDAIRDYIEYYNQKRIKIKLKGLTPLEYRKLVLS